MTPSGTLTELLNQFITVFNGGIERIQPTIHGITGTLLVIEVCLFGLFYALGEHERISQVMRKVLFIGFWLWMIGNYATLAKSFMHSLVTAGLTIAGAESSHHSLIADPSAIIDYGTQATSTLVEKLDTIQGWEVLNAIIFGLLYLGIMACFILIAIQVCLAVLEFYVIVSIGGIFMPFALNEKTKFLSEKAIGAIVGTSVKLMVLALIIGIVDPVLKTVRIEGPDIQFAEMFRVFATVIFITFLAWNAPGMAAGFLAGSPSLSAGTLGQNMVAGATMGAMGAMGASRLMGATASAAQSGLAAGARGVGQVSGGFQQGYASGGMAAGLAGGLGAAVSGVYQGTVGRRLSGLKSSARDHYQQGLAQSRASDGSTSTPPSGTSSPPGAASAGGVSNGPAASTTAAAGAPQTDGADPMGAPHNTTASDAAAAMPGSPSPAPPTPSGRAAEKTYKIPRPPAWARRMQRLIARIPSESHRGVPS